MSTLWKQHILPCENQQVISVTKKKGKASWHSLRKHHSPLQTQLIGLLAIKNISKVCGYWEQSKHCSALQCLDCTIRVFKHLLTTSHPFVFPGYHSYPWYVLLTFSSGKWHLWRGMKKIFFTCKVLTCSLPPVGNRSMFKTTTRLGTILASWSRTTFGRVFFFFEVKEFSLWNNLACRISHFQRV